MKKQQKLTDFKLEQIIAGHACLPKNQVYVDRAKRICRKVAIYYDPHVRTLDYLRGIAHNFDLH